MSAEMERIRKGLDGNLADLGLDWNQAQIDAAASAIERLSGAMSRADLVRVAQVVALDVTQPDSGSTSNFKWLHTGLRELARDAFPAAPGARRFVQLAALEVLSEARLKRDDLDSSFAVVFLLTELTPGTPDGRWREVLDGELGWHLDDIAPSEDSEKDREIQALWWGQTRYSRARRASYRDLSGVDRLYQMAEDLLDLWGPDPDEALTAWYVETVLAVDKEAEQLTWLALARGLPPAAFSPAPAPLDVDPTAAPITTLLHRGPPGSDLEIERIWAESCVPPLTGRPLLRQLFRERQLVRWLKQT